MRIEVDADKIKVDYGLMLHLWGNGYRLPEDDTQLREGIVRVLSDLPSLRGNVVKVIPGLLYGQTWEEIAAAQEIAQHDVARAAGTAWEVLSGLAWPIRFLLTDVRQEPIPLTPLSRAEFATWMGVPPGVWSNLGLGGRLVGALREGKGVVAIDPRAPALKDFQPARAPSLCDALFRPGRRIHVLDEFDEMVDSLAAKIREIELGQQAQRVLSLLAEENATVRDVAEDLGLSVGTVHYHRAGLLDALGIDRDHSRNLQQVWRPYAVAAWREWWVGRDEDRIRYLGDKYWGIWNDAVLRIEKALRR